jgi:hypothetical protein
MTGLPPRTPGPTTAKNATPAMAAIDIVRDPDAEVIRLCGEYIEAVTAYNAHHNAHGGCLACEDDPLWHAILAVKQKLDGLAPRTIEGVAAKARVAVFLARQVDGSENFSESYTLDWPERVICDLLRLAGAGNSAQRLPAA